MLASGQVLAIVGTPAEVTATLLGLGYGAAPHVQPQPQPWPEAWPQQDPALQHASGVDHSNWSEQPAFASRQPLEADTDDVTESETVWAQAISGLGFGEGSEGSYERTGCRSACMEDGNEPRCSGSSAGFKGEASGATSGPSSPVSEEGIQEADATMQGNGTGGERPVPCLWINGACQGSVPCEIPEVQQMRPHRPYRGRLLAGDLHRRGVDATWHEIGAEAVSYRDDDAISGEESAAAEAAVNDRHSVNGFTGERWSAHSHRPISSPSRGEGSRDSCRARHEGTIVMTPPVEHAATPAYIYGARNADPPPLAPLWPDGHQQGAVHYFIGDKDGTEHMRGESVTTTVGKGGCEVIGAADASTRTIGLLPRPPEIDAERVDTGDQIITRTSGLLPRPPERADGQSCCAHYRVNLLCRRPFRFQLVRGA